VSEIQDHIRNLDYLTLSLTEEKNNLLMWSHYAKSHKGFVIGFESENIFFSEKTLSGISPIFNVRYSAERPDYSLTEGSDYHNMYENILLTKSPHWSYEKELRMFARSHIGKNIGKDENDFDVYVFNFSPECLKEIIFGYRMSTDSKQKIVNLVENRYPNLKIFEAHLSETHFDLDINPYKKP